MAAGDEERHRPLPPLTRLPAYLWRQLPTPARVAVAVLAAAAVATAAVTAPRIRESKQEHRLEERREEAALEARRIRALRALQRPRTERSRSVDPVGARPATRQDRRRALLRDLTDAIADDARSCGARDVLRTPCHPEEGAPRPERDLDRTRVPLACVAVTSSVPASEHSRGVDVGYPYRAVADFRSGRSTFCRVAGQPGEGGLIRQRQVAIPAACTR